MSRWDCFPPGGLVVDGEEVTGTVRVDLGTDGALSVVTLTGFEVWEDAPTVVAIEMQSRLWLRLVDAALRRVDLDDFRQIFRVRVRQRIVLPMRGASIFPGHHPRGRGVS